MRCEAVWWDAMDRIGFQRPTDIPHATEWVDEMVEMIGQLLEIGRAYRTDDGVYLSVRSVEDYGLLAQQALDDMLAGGGEREVVGAEGKRDSADFALWKLAKPGEPSWPSPWGDGRPGWHSECVVMSLGILGEGFDLHAGGLDLKFPHHENERAQAVALGRRFTEHWMHHAFVVDRSGEKMSKSLGNYENLLDFTEQHDPRAFRLMLLQAHYRSPVSMDAELASAAERTLDGLDAFARRSASVEAAEADPDVLARFRERMDDDLDTPGAMAVVFDTVRRANSAIDAGSSDVAPLVAAVREMTGAVGLELGGVDEGAGGGHRAGGRARCGAGGQGLRRRRRHPRRAASRRLDRRDHRHRDDRSPVTALLGPSDATGEVQRPARASRRRFGYEPGLDGLRALSVVAVICYHAGFAVDARRVDRRRGVLRRLRVPDHVALARRARGVVPHRPRAVLAAARTAAAAGARRRPRGGGGGDARRRFGGAARRRATGHAVGARLSRQLGPDRRRRAVLRRRPTAAPAPVEPGDRGAVLPVVATGLRRPDALAAEHGGDRPPARRHRPGVDGVDVLAPRRRRRGQLHVPVDAHPSDRPPPRRRRRLRLAPLATAVRVCGAGHASAAGARTPTSEHSTGSAGWRSGRWDASPAWRR